MRRVCRPGGRIIFLNHFLSPNPLLSRVERLISPFTIHIGFKADLDLPAFLAQAELQPVSIEKVNVPRIWSLVTCVKDSARLIAALRPIRHLRWYIAGCSASRARSTISIARRSRCSPRPCSASSASPRSNTPHLTTSFLVSYTVMYAVSGRIIDWLGMKVSAACAMM